MAKEVKMTVKLKCIAGLHRFGQHETGAADGALGQDPSFRVLFPVRSLGRQGPSGKPPRTRFAEMLSTHNWCWAPLPHRPLIPPALSALGGKAGSLCVGTLPCRALTLGKGVSAASGRSGRHSVRVLA